jgi:hypothetical protein
MDSNICYDCQVKEQKWTTRMALLSAKWCTVVSSAASVLSHLLGLSQNTRKPTVMPQMPWSQSSGSHPTSISSGETTKALMMAQVPMNQLQGGVELEFMGLMSPRKQVALN